MLDAWVSVDGVIQVQELAQPLWDQIDAGVKGTVRGYTRVLAHMHFCSTRFVRAERTSHGTQPQAHGRSPMPQCRAWAVTVVCQWVSAY